MSRDFLYCSVCKPVSAPFVTYLACLTCCKVRGQFCVAPAQFKSLGFRAHGREQDRPESNTMSFNEKAHSPDRGTFHEALQHTTDLTPPAKLYLSFLAGSETGRSCRSRHRIQAPKQCPGGKTSHHGSCLKKLTTEAGGENPSCVKVATFEFMYVILYNLNR